MSKSTLVRFGLIPALILVLMTILRAKLEISQPGAMTTRLLSVMTLGPIWILISAILLLRAGVSFGRYLGTMAIFAFLIRGAIATAYTLAWVNKWRTPDGKPTRYELQVAEMVTRLDLGSDVSPVLVWALNTAAPTIGHILFAILVWFVAWAIAFRRKRPAAKGAAA